ncbi:MAG: cysteine--tRNA ligase [Thermoplasmatales archaeon]|jgi:cysteinyl-tRNA synthetase|nr:cysteine--tRNA ligase [Thermoplasmatales archaeon]
MSLKIHNTLTGKKEDFVPIEKGKVKIYVCGVTVYDDIHMGHARSMIVFDTVVKYLKYSGYEVTHITNFTDVDDKIINRANEAGIPPLELSARYIEEYFRDAEALGIGKADIYPKASESMDVIIAMVQEIMDNGFAYEAEDGSVYFSVRKVKDYGRLTHRSLDDMESSGRIAEDPMKEDQMDFAIWKSAKPGEIAWDSPWGKGRPGWHIECSAMIRSHLGDKIDIHGGGNDLIFPHHENEILQTEACTGEPLANYWMHNGMLQVKGEKMSKSLGNFFRVKDVASKYDPQTIRFYFLNTHYMSPLIYSEEALEESSLSLRRLVNNYRELQSRAKAGASGSDMAKETEEARRSFTESFDDDFNSRGAIEALFVLAKKTNKAMADGTMSSEGAETVLSFLNEANSILGIFSSEVRSDDALDKVMDILIAIRGELRKSKQYGLADEIRDRLADADIVLEDTADGVKWKRA